MERREFDPRNDGIAYKENVWMVAGYISDFMKTEVTKDGEVVTEVSFTNKTGYVDDHNTVHIYYDDPRTSDLFPWFTVEKHEDGTYELVFNPYQDDEIDLNFNINRVVNMSVPTIAKDSEGIDNLYDEDVMDDFKNASSKYVPEIKDYDDFLKKIVKTMLLEKDVDAHRYKNVVDKGYIISNLIQGLTMKTKMNPNTFGTWMGLGCCNFKIIVEDNGGDPKYPLKNRIIYDSETNRIYVEGKDEEDKNYAVSAKQYAD